jgi:tricorn protease interacting factor F2/3
MMRHWIEQPGYPLLEVARRKNRLHLCQHRFSYLPGAADATWLLPVTIRLFGADGAQQTLKLLMEGPEEQVEIDPSTEAFKVNDAQSGFYRVRYRDADNLNRLGALAQDRRLSAADRWGLAADLYALLKAGRIDLEQYLSFIDRYRSEDRLLPLGQIAANLHHLLVLLPEPERDRIRTFSASFLGSRLSTLGLEPADDEPHDRSILRDQLFWPAAVAGDEVVRSFGKAKFEALVSGAAVSPEIFRGVLQIGAMTRGTEAISWFLQRLGDSENEHERMAISVAMGCLRGKPQIQTALKAVLETIPGRNKFIPVVAMAANPDAIPHLWGWYVDHQPQIEGFHPLLYERVVAALIPACGVERETEVTDYFNDHLRRTPLAADAIRMAMERLRIDIALRRRCTEGR